MLGYAVPFDEWPEETKQYYRYDPEEAERLLDEAGYPRGADGTRFSTIYQHYEFFDLGYYQIAMDYLRQIGIDVEIQEISCAQNTEFGLNRAKPWLNPHQEWGLDATWGFVAAPDDA